jgi:A/G-specific adenine glycosylase
VSVQTSQRDDDGTVEVGNDFADRLLAWYDRAARVLPWRIAPNSGLTPDPYRIWLAEVMLQQTTVAAVAGYFARFTERWPTVDDLAAADDADVMAAWAGLGYYARARNLLACARAVVRDHGGSFPIARRRFARCRGLATIPPPRSRRSPLAARRSSSTPISSALSRGTA